MPTRIILCAIVFSWYVGSATGQVVEEYQLDTISQKIITDILFEGNDLTKERIIKREMTIATGDTLYWSNLQAGMEQSKNNIMNLRLFNFVEIEPVMTDNEHVILLVSVQERWYLYPVPIFEIAQTNFNTWWETKELRWLNYGLSVSHSNFRGLNQDLSFTLRFGYTKRFSASYTIPNLNQKQTLGLHLSARYYENRQIAYNTSNNERLFFSVDGEKARKYYLYKVGLSLRENIYLRHYFELSFFDAYVNDSIPNLQPDYFTGGGDHSRFLRASYIITYDTRDYQRYPLKGTFVFGALNQDGLGLINKEGMSLFTTSAGYRQYYKLGNRIYAAYSLEGKVNWDDPPYYLVEGLGYSAAVRGYEYYVMDGTRYGVLATNFKYEILKPKSIDLPLIPTEKFSKTFVALYGNLFFDSGYVYGKDFENDNSLVNKYLYSGGIGLDIVTYYDRVLRLEGTINALGEPGFYVHFKQAF